MDYAGAIKILKQQFARTAAIAERSFKPAIWHPLILPKSFKPIRRERCISHGVLDIAVPHVGLE